MSKKSTKNIVFNTPRISVFSSYGWAIYFTGGMLSFSTYRILAVIIGVVGLTLILLAAVFHPKDQFVLLGLKTLHRLQGILLISFLVCAFFKILSVAFLVLGAAFFETGCFGLKYRAIYLNGTFFDPYGTRYTRETNPYIYWGATILFLSFGSFLLLGILWAGNLIRIIQNGF